MNNRCFAPCRLTVAATMPLVALAFAAPAVAQSPQGDAGQPDLVPVALWTFAIVCLAMLALSLGYLYRRARGEPDELIPKNVDPYYAVEGQEEKHGTSELHPEMAHDAVGFDAAEREYHGTDVSPAAPPSAPRADVDALRSGSGAAHGGH